MTFFNFCIFIFVEKRNTFALKNHVKQSVKIERKPTLKNSLFTGFNLLVRRGMSAMSEIFTYVLDCYIFVFTQD